MKWTRTLRCLLVISAMALGGALAWGAPTHLTVAADGSAQYKVDFIFGAATAFFEGCRIHCLRDGYITAASTPDNQPWGFVFSNCRITAEPKVRTYLGRPWRGYASVTFLNTDICGAVRPEGWHNWKMPEREKTARFAEFGSRGPGANPGARVAWARPLDAAQAAAITRQNVLGGADHWNSHAGFAKR